MGLNTVIKAIYNSHPLLKRLMASVFIFFVSKLALLQRFRLKWTLQKYYDGSTDPEIIEVLTYLENNPVQMIPYEYVSHHYARRVEIRRDENDGYPYVKIEANKVYFPKEMSSREIEAAVQTAYTEQDSRSPHKYLADGFELENEEVGVFVGASDGIFCLSVLHHFNSIYLFEADPIWQKPLELTFRNWGPKVNIIPLYVSDTDSSLTVSLDTFFANTHADITYIQADIEGHEKELLVGAANLINNSHRLKISICTYHRHNDLDDFTNILTKADMRVSCSKGYLIMWQQVPLRRPYLRRGLIYAAKSAAAVNMIGRKLYS